MRPQLLIRLLFTSATTALAFLIPHDLPDGDYFAVPNPTSPDESSHMILPRSEAAPFMTALPRYEHSSPHRLQVRRAGWRSGTNDTLKESLKFPKTKTFCWPEQVFNRSDFYPSLQELFQEPLYWVQPRSAKFSLQGSVVTYVCNIAGWNVMSLVEYMKATEMIDAKCGAEVGGKIAIAKWEKMYGRESRGEKICEWEADKGGIKNDAMKVQKWGCQNYVNAIIRLLGGERGCNEGSRGGIFWAEMKKKFPWYVDNHPLTKMAKEEQKLEDNKRKELELKKDGQGKQGWIDVKTQVVREDGLSRGR